MECVDDTKPKPKGIPFSAKVMCLVAMLTQWSQSTVEFVAYFIIKQKGWGATDNSFYAVMYAIRTFVPVILNPILGYFSKIMPIRIIMACAMCISIPGILIMTLCPVELSFLYPIGMFMYACQAVRPLRTTYISRVTDPGVRTSAMAYMNLWTDSFRLMGLVTASFWTFLLGDHSYVVGGISFDHLTAPMLTAVALTLIGVVILYTVFVEEGRRVPSSSALSGAGGTARITWTRQVLIVKPDGEATTVDSTRLTWALTLTFLCMVFVHGITTGATYVSGLPVLSQHFNLSKEEVSHIKLVQDMVPIPMPLLVAYEAKFYSDRQLLLFGFFMTWVGCGMFSIPPIVTYWQPIIGTIIVTGSQAFFYTAVFSLFTKILGIRASGTKVAWLASAIALGSTCGYLLGGTMVGPWYGHWGFFGLLVAWSMTAGAILISPCLWSKASLQDPVLNAVLKRWEQDTTKLVYGSV